MHEAALACKITPGRDADDHDRWDQESSILMLYSDLCSFLVVPENSSAGMMSAVSVPIIRIA